MNDDDMRARLRAADPARQLSDPRKLELTEAMMSTPTPAGMNRNRLALVAAAAAVLVIAAVGLVLGLGKDDNSTPAAKPTPTKALTSATYTLQAGAAARCLPPNVNTIRGMDVAFRATAARVGKSQIDLVPAEFYTGARTDRVVLSVHSAPAGTPELLPVDFKAGKSYVVAVKNGLVQLCGYSAEATPGLRKLYATALGTS